VVLGDEQSPAIGDPIQMAGSKIRIPIKKKNGSNTPSIPRAPPPSRDSLQPAAAYGSVMGRRRQLPMIAGMADKLLVSNYEQVGTITGTSSNGNFSKSTIICNPGDSSVFAWLSNIALNYQKFRWKFFRLIYVPQVPSTTTGSAYIFLSYDFLDATPTTLKQVTTSSESCAGNCWFGGPIDESAAFKPAVATSDFISITANPREYSQPWYYVRNAANAENLTTIQFGSTTNTGAITVGQDSGASAAIPTGSASTLVRIPDTSARPVTASFGASGVADGVVSGYVYAAYQCEFAGPVAPASQN